MEEPFGMLFDPGVVRRALEGNVEPQFHAVVMDGGDQVVEVGEGAERGMDGLVTAFSRANCPRAAFVFPAGGDGVIDAFTEGGANGMDGRQVDDAEAPL